MLPQVSQDRLRLLLDVNNAIVSNLSLKQVLLAVSECLRKFVAHDFASIVIKDEETGQFRVHALDGTVPGHVLEEGSILPIDGTPPGIAIVTRQTVRRERIDFKEFYSPIIGYFTQKHALRMNKRVDKIPKDTVDALCDYPWPGNVRELENFLERSVILSSGVELQAPLAELKVTSSMAVSQPKPSACSLEDVERRHIAEILEQTRGVIGGKGGAAQILGLPTSTLRNRMKKLGLK